MSKLKRDFTKIIFSTYGRTTVDSSWHISHHHGTNRFYYIHSGTATFKDKRGSHSLCPGNFYFFSSNIPFDISCDKYLDHSFIDFTILPPVFAEQFITLDSSTPDLLTAVATALFRLVENYPNYPSYINNFKYREMLELYLESILILMVDFGYLNRNINSNLDNVLSHIHNNIINPISVEDLANIACMEKNYFIKFFKKYMNITPYKYIQKHRMDFAIQLLQKNNRISEVAELCGFTEVSSFSRAFKSHFGYYPTYIKKNSSFTNV